MSTLSSTPAIQPAETVSVGITVQDLQNLLMVIELACQRGAFRAPELTQVGSLFDKINQFVQSTLPPVVQEQTQTQNETRNVEQQQPAMQGSPVMPMSPPFTPKVGN